jgi:N-acetylglucosamine kinase-like BadF-type ATPase
MLQAMHGGMEQALHAAGLKKEEITGAGFGIAGYDWPSEIEANIAVIDRLGLKAPYKFVNDAVLGLAASEEG